MDIQRRYQVFVSSTYEDLRAERAQVSQAILELGHFPAGMELFPASDDSQWEVIKRVIDESDYYVVVVAGRYGSQAQDGTSYTEKEFNYALERHIPVLGFIRRDIASLPLKYSETSSTTKKSLDLFREKVKTRSCRYFETPEELGLVVSKSLISAISTNPRTGWVRADQAKQVSDFELVESLRKEIRDLELKNEGLVDFLRNSVLPAEEIGEVDLEDDDDLFELSIQYRRGNEARVEKVAVSWREMFEVVAPDMWGYLRGHERNAYPSSYFEQKLTNLVQRKVPERVGNVSLKFLQSEIDTIIFQFKQLGYIYLGSNEDVRGWTLTKKGQAKLTRLKIRTKAPA